MQVLSGAIYRFRLTVLIIRHNKMSTGLTKTRCSFFCLNYIRAQIPKGLYFSGRSISILMVRKISPQWGHFHSVLLFFAFLCRNSRNSYPHLGQGVGSLFQSLLRKITSSSLVFIYKSEPSFKESSFRQAPLPEDFRPHNEASAKRRELPSSEGRGRFYPLPISEWNRAFRGLSIQAPLRRIQ